MLTMSWWGNGMAVAALHHSGKFVIAENGDLAYVVSDIFQPYSFSTTTKFQTLRITVGKSSGLNLFLGTKLKFVTDISV